LFCHRLITAIGGKGLKKKKEHKNRNNMVSIEKKRMMTGNTAIFIRNVKEAWRFCFLSFLSCVYTPMDEKVTYVFFY
jgi:hypothetical protein